MKQTKEQIIAKVSSFKYEELEEWMRSRLHGEDKYFPINEGDETNLSRFLKDIHENIRNKESRDNFLEILKDMVDELAGYCREEIIKEAEYIYELLSLCACFKELENIDILYEIAVYGDLKGFKAFDMDLHQSILITLASFNLSGDYEFWLEQIKNDSNQSYTQTAIYSLIKHGYRLDIIFKGIEIFIDRFKNTINLVDWIKYMLNYFNILKLANPLKAIEHKLSTRQKKAVNIFFYRNGYGTVYQLSPPHDPGITGLKYPFIWPVEKVIPRLKSIIKSTASLQEKWVKIFKCLDFQVELNLEIAGHTIAAFIKRRNISSFFNEYWVCFFDDGQQKTGEDMIWEFNGIKELVRIELLHEFPIEESDNFRGLVISRTGFTNKAFECQTKCSMDLLTLDELISFF